MIDKKTLDHSDRVVRSGRARSSAFLLISLVLIAPLRAQIDEGKPYGRICFLVIDRDKEGNWETLGNEGKLGPKRRIIGCVDANTPCELLIAAFNAKNRLLVREWKPQIVPINGEWKEVKIPIEPARWIWDEPREEFEVWAAFLARGSKRAEIVKSILQKLDHSGEKDVNRLADALRRELSSFLADDASAHRVKVEPLRMAGEYRSSSSIPWREHADRVNFSETNPGILIFSSARKP